MNPFEMMIIALSGVLIVILLKNFLFELMTNKDAENDRIDLMNIIDIYKEGMWLNASFNVSYKPSRSGFLNITQGAISLNNVSATNPGISPVNCSYDLLVITNGGIKCLKN